MKVHNLMEEYVESRVNTFYDRLNEEKATWLTCDCEVCRNDAISYVLNRIPPRYVVSSRGINHNAEIINNSQLRADIDALTNHGVHMINSMQRPFHMPSTNTRNNDERTHIPSFNFPLFTGTIFDGVSFNPLSGVNVMLKNQDGSTVEMFDTTWENPCITYNITNGNYSFWVKPLRAEKKDITKNFHFTIEATLQGYTPMIYGFDISITSKEDEYKTISDFLKIPDIFMFDA